MVFFLGAFWLELMQARMNSFMKGSRTIRLRALYHRRNWLFLSSSHHGRWSDDSRITPLWESQI